jgi:hypothetical protein
MRRDLRSEKKSIVAENMALSGNEAGKVWRAYDQYAAEVAKTNDTKLSV